MRGTLLFALALALAAAAPAAAAAADGDVKPHCGGDADRSWKTLGPGDKGQLAELLSGEFAGLFKVGAAACGCQGRAATARRCCAPSR